MVRPQFSAGEEMGTMTGEGANSVFLDGQKGLQRTLVVFKAISAEYKTAIVTLATSLKCDLHKSLEITALIRAEACKSHSQQMFFISGLS